MIEPALIRIAARLVALANDPEQITAEELRLIERQIGNQCEMFELGLAEVAA